MKKKGFSAEQIIGRLLYGPGKLPPPYEFNASTYLYVTKWIDR